MKPKRKKRYLEQLKLEGKYKTGIHPLRILIDLDNMGYDNQIELAKLIGKSQPSVNQVIYRRTSSTYIRGRISKILGKTFVEVWGMTEEESVSRKTIN